ncbi:hypothetical protein [uncultured Tateyamaria sp.]|uniref:hypothetical protein n=1 Tax=uncultured Tateyamaria sp. TaxID=455651 RepID=UPI00261E36B9|nr:hypothetical protein [uncultured Tateyamaria sp.]
MALSYVSATAQSSNDADVSATPLTVLVDGDALPTLKRDLYALDDGVGAFETEVAPLSMLDADAYIWVVDGRDTFVPDKDHIFHDPLRRMIVDQPGDAETVLEWSVLRLVDDRDGRIHRVRLVLPMPMGCDAIRPCALLLGCGTSFILWIPKAVRMQQAIRSAVWSGAVRKAGPLRWMPSDSSCPAPLEMHKNRHIAVTKPFYCGCDISW